MSAADRPEGLAALLEARPDLDAALRAFFLRRVPAADAEDLVQECYLRIREGLSGLHSRERLGAWLFSIARNLVADHGRRRQRAPAALPDPELVADDGEAAGTDFDRRIAAWLAAQIHRLPATYAAAVRAAEIDGLPHRVIAADLGLTVAAVKARVRRGRALLRGMLLACCTLEFDARGRIADYRRNRPGACGCDAEPTAPRG